ncbi:hypothetical protein AM202_05998 [Actinobacillus minor 202]|uniref:Uncharacterized protein n=1 Tax=Actinobacillus minor 202 TaxID=591023 RepID=A0ABP2GU49_9PAST|nr:hypothetical protein AM202_05998 [Actinobacillus minor 202]
MALLLPSKAINATEILTAKKRRTPKEGAFAKIGFIELTSKNKKRYEKNRKWTHSVVHFYFYLKI